MRKKQNKTARENVPQKNSCKVKPKGWEGMYPQPELEKRRQI